jgi:hypothetical protein
VTRKERQDALFHPFGKGSGVFGRDLRCDCGEGAKDVSPSYEIGERESLSWSCKHGHEHVTGYKPDGTETMTFHSRFVKP